MNKNVYLIEALEEREETSICFYVPGVHIVQKCYRVWFIRICVPWLSFYWRRVCIF